MEFRILGPLEVSDAGGSLPVGGHRQRLVLAVLLLNANSAVSVDRLIDDVWGDAPPPTARKTLQTYIARLRKTIGADDLTASDSGYMLHVGADDLDSDRFERLAREGRGLLEDDPAGASLLLNRALSEWRGMPWGDLGSEFALLAEGQRLKELRLVARENRIEAELATGADADLIPELRGLVAHHPWRERFVGLLMLALYRSGRQAEALAAFQDARRSLGEELGIVPSPELRQLEEQILLQDPALHVSTATRIEPTIPARNPYKGLHAFTEADSADFHGRDALTEELIRGVRESSFVAVVGPSGSGKSSVVKAGVIPVLRQDGDPEGRDWLVATMVPGAHPFEELETALLRATNGPIAGLADQIQGDDLDVLRCVLRVLPTEKTHLLLMIDQFEELFTLTDDSEVRNRFFRNVVQAVEDPHSRLTIVATLRADFYGRVLSEPDIGLLVNTGLVNVLPLTTPELEAAALTTARDVGVEIEAELAAELITDTHDQPGALPLFQYVLTELYEERDGTLLTLAGYRRLGGLRGALALRADETYESLGTAQKDVTRQVFLRLVSLQEDGELTRMRVPRADLEALGADTSDVGTVLDRFDAARLLTFDRDRVQQRPTVEVVHEALFREWKRLADWIGAARDDLRFHGSLTAEIREWEQSDRDPDYLATGSRLDVFESWQRNTSLRATTTEREYLDLSLARRDAERDAEQNRIDRETHLRQRSVRRLQWLVAVAAIAALVAATLTVLAVNRGRETQASQRLTRAADLAYEASLSLDIDPERSILLALEAIDTTRSSDGFVRRGAEEALHAAVNAHRLVRVAPGSIDAVFVSDDLLLTGGESLDLIDGKTGEVVWSVESPGSWFLSVAASADGRIIATGDGSGRVLLWDPATGDRIRELEHNGRVAHESYVRDIVFNSDGSLLASVSAGALNLRVWEVESGEQLINIEQPKGAGWQSLPEVPQLAFHPNGTELAVTGFWDTAVEVLDVPSGEWGEPYPADETPTLGVRYFPDGTRLATSDVDGTISVWDTATRSVLFSILPVDPGVLIPFLDVDRDGGRLVATGFDDTLHMWDISTFGAQATFTLATGQPGLPGGVSISPDGMTVASASEEDVRIWDVTQAGRGELLTMDGGGPALAFSADGTRLAVTNSDGDIALLDTSNWQTEVLLELPGGDEPQRHVVGVGWSPDAHAIATAMQRGAPLVGPGLIQTWDSLTGNAVHVLSDAWPRIDVAYGPDGIVAASICQRPSSESNSWRSSARVWDGASGEELFVSPINDCGHAVDLDSQGQLLAVQTELDIGNIQIWDLRSENIVRSLEHRPGFVGSIRFSPDGGRVLAAGTDGVRIWEVETGHEQLHLGGRAGSVTRAVWTPDGTRVVAGGTDGSIRIWDAMNGVPLLSLQGDSGEVVGLAVSPDGTMLAWSAEGGPTHVWTLDIERLVEVARSRLTRSFTQAECAAYHIGGCGPAPGIR